MNFVETADKGVVREYLNMALTEARRIVEEMRGLF
jgi:hypothetical protein